MNIKKKFIFATLFLLGAVGNAQRVGADAFAGVWMSADGSRAFDIRYAPDGQLECGVNIAGEGQYTNLVAQVDSVLYIDFLFPPEYTRGCDTLYPHLLFIARFAADGSLEVQRKELEELQSPIFGKDLRVVSDTLYVLHKKKTYHFNQSITHTEPIKEQFDFDPRSNVFYYIADEYYNGFLFNLSWFPFYDESFKEINDSIEKQNDQDSNGREKLKAFRLWLEQMKDEKRLLEVENRQCVDSAKFYYNKALQSALKNKGSKKNSDDELLAGYSANHLMVLEDSLIKKRQYADLALQYLPDAYVMERSFAKGWKVVCDFQLSQNFRDFFHSFKESSEFINGYDALEDLVKDNLAMKDVFSRLLGIRNCFFINYFNDIGLCLTDMRRFKDVDSNNVWKRKMYDLLSHWYGWLGVNADTASDLPLDTNLIARRYYEKSLEYFDSAKVEMVTKDDVGTFWPVYYACERLGVGRPSLEDFYDTLCAYYYQHPDNFWHKSSNEVVRVMSFLLNNGRTDEVLAFYDQIKGNFRYDGIVNLLYFDALVENGFAGDEVSNAIRLSNSVKRQKGEENSIFDTLFQNNLYLSAAINIENNDYDAAYNDLMKLKLEFDTANLFTIRLFMMGQKEGNKQAYEYCDYLIRNNYVHDTLLSSLLYYRGWFAELWAQEMEDGPDKDGLLAKSISDYNTAISIDDSLKLPYVFLRLGQKEKALRIVEYNLHREGGPDEYDYMTAADIYCMMGDTCRAKEYVKRSLEINHEAFLRTWFKELDPELEPIKDYISSIVDQYAKEDTSISRYKTLKFDTLRTVIPFVVSETGSMYVSCQINGLDIEQEAKIDNGADFVQISKELLCDMYGSGMFSHDSYLGETPMTTADGSSHQMKCVMLRTLKLGDIILHNVEAVVSENEEAPLLLGQSVLANFIMEVNPFKAQITLTKLDEIRE